MNQTKIESLCESVINILIGYFVALASQLIVFPQFGIHISLSANLWIGAWFTVISLARSYMIRRWFNAGLHKTAIVIAREIAALWFTVR